MKKLKPYLSGGYDPVHLWFELTYCNYIVWPRSIMQSMPRGWQKRFVKLADEMTEICEKHGISTGGYKVQAVDDKGRFRRDIYANYDRGRRNVFKEAE